MANVGKVVNGVLQDANNAITSTSKDTTGTSELGKEAFLQLLVCQMQNQDPLNPQDDTQFVTQLATFSQLEQMQNLNAAYQKSQAFSLIGKDVILNVEDATGKEKQVAGTVQYVNASGSNAQLYVNGELYDLDDLYAVLTEDYVKAVCSPSIKESYNFTYDANEPKNYMINVELGDGEYAADEVALLINNKVVDSTSFKLDGEKLYIYGSAFENLEDGTYAVSVVFNDDDYTTVMDKVTVTVVNSKAGADAENGDETDNEAETDAADKTNE